jgi:release factor glutamine methyltransferase
MAAPQDTWTILQILRWTTDYFGEKGVSEPRASAEVLLAHVLALSRLDLYLRYDQPLSPEELARFKALVVRRRAGEPVAYLTGHREFWSLDFRVGPGVLIPRPETEVLVQAALEMAGELGIGKQAPGAPASLENQPETGPLWGLEIGVGSGAVVVALARELPSMRWVALDLSTAALEVARDNARCHGVAERLRFLRADLLSAFKPCGHFTLVVANLPYVPRGDWEQLPKDIKDYEPEEALLAGADGLDLIRPLVRQAHRYLQPGGWLALEVGDGQAGPVLGLLEETQAYDRFEAVQDYHGVARVVRSRRRPSA